MKRLAAAIILALAFCSVAKAGDWDMIVCRLTDAGDLQCIEVYHGETYLPFVMR